METLTIKELSPYLPYGLKGVETQKGSIKELLSIDLVSGLRVGDLKEDYMIPIIRFKPLLRPLSDLLQEYDLQNGYEGWESEWIEHIWDFAGKVEEANILACPYELMQDLLSKHFDIFQLIPKGLAIDLNTIKETE